MLTTRILNRIRNHKKPYLTQRKEGRKVARELKKAKQASGSESTHITR
ncbi:hypothetical protein VP501E541_P0119 [Vibrio phage 501E54-1]|nr:hypothetical protein VP501E541_P0119 [Vibrio phage 501E54-1]